MRSARPAWVLGLLTAVLTVAGCGDGLSEVSGTVKFDGKEVEKGTIGFIPIDGKGPTTGGPITDGKYSVRVPVGLMKVEIRATKAGAKKKSYDGPGGKWYETVEELLPEKYHSKSELQLEVVSGANQKDWDLPAK
jgi:hypothetical protein